MSDKVFLVVGYYANEADECENVKYSVFKHREDAENFAVAISSQELLMKIEVEEMTVREGLNHDARD